MSPTPRVEEPSRRSDVTGRESQPTSLPEPIAVGAAPVESPAARVELLPPERIGQTASPEPDVIGYNVLRSAVAGGPYEAIAKLVLASEFRDDTGAPEADSYYIVTATDRNGNESAESVEVQSHAIVDETLPASFTRCAFQR